MRGWWLGLALALPGGAQAHDFRPARLDLTAGPAGYTARWIVEAEPYGGDRLRPVLPCGPADAPRITRLGSRTVERWTLACAPGWVALQGAALPAASALVTVTWPDGRVERAHLTAARPRRALRPPAQAPGIDATLLALGRQAAGALGLLLLLAGARRARAPAALGAGAGWTLGWAWGGPSAAAAGIAALALAWVAARPWARHEGRWVAAGALVAGWAWGAVTRPPALDGAAWVGLALGLGAIMALGDALARRAGPRPGWVAIAASVGLGAWGVRDALWIMWTGSAG